MSCSIDRTSEFFSLIDVLKKHEGTEASGLVQLQRSLPGGSSSASGAVGSSSSSALHRAARSISEDIRSSQRRIVRLGKLAHRRGLFDDPQKEVLELTQRAKVDLATIEGAIVSLQREVFSQFGNAVGGGGGGGGLSRISSSGGSTLLLSQHWTVVIEILRSLSIRLARDLQTALKARSESIRDQAFRRRDFVHSKWTPAASALPLDSPLFASSSGGNGGDENITQRSNPSNTKTISASSSTGALSPLPPSQLTSTATALRRRPQGHGASSSLTLPYPSSSSSSSYSGNLISGPGRPLSSVSPYNSSYPPPPPPPSSSSVAFSGRFNVPKGSTSLRSAQQLSLTHGAISREEDMREVESTIVELGTVFTQVAGLVAEQGELIERIDADMDTASANVDAGHSELGKYFESVKKNRGLIIRLLLVTAFVVFLFAVMRPSGGKQRRGWVW